MLRIIEISEGLSQQEEMTIKEELIIEIKEYLYSGIFKNPTGALANSITGYLKDHFIYVYSDKAYANAIDQGISPHIMWHLLGKTIPLKNIGYRTVSLKSIAEGKWRHPGHPGYQFIDAAMARVSDKYPGVSMRVVR